MLRYISIQHYTLIDELHINFHEGFSVITGETGSGKSILLGALGLLLGNRADSHVIQTGQSKCVIEAEFCIKGYQLEEFFANEGFDYDEESCIIRRELTAAGKSRAFINDSPASLTQLRELGNQLIDIHSQHQNMLLGQEAYQLSTLDIIAGNRDLCETYGAAYQLMNALQHSLDERRELAQKGKAELDYMQFQYNQLAEFSPREGEDEELEALRNELEHAEEIKGTLCQVDAALSDSGQSVLTMLNTTRQMLSSLARVYPKAEDLASRADSCYIELKDIAAEVADNAEDIECNPERLQEVLQRLDALYDLQQKHNVNSSAELLQLMQSLQERLDSIENADEDLHQMELQLQEQTMKVQALAKQISEKRQAAASLLEKQCNEMLASLGMPNARLHMELTASAELRPSGMDCCTLLFSANKNTTMQSIAQVASGGEVARVMLALKCITSKHRALPTIIFDEIDTGVSGRIAEAMAHIMQQMAKVGGQTIAITHLPQIAACGQHHYKVYKEDDVQGTHSHVIELNAEERISELAKMLSGENVTQAAIDNARELLTTQSE